MKWKNLETVIQYKLFEMKRQGKQLIKNKQMKSPHSIRLEWGCSGNVSSMSFLWRRSPSCSLLGSNTLPSELSKYIREWIKFFWGIRLKAFYMKDTVRNPASYHTWSQSQPVNTDEIIFKSKSTFTPVANNSSVETYC